jgi:hypothetical protein
MQFYRKQANGPRLSEIPVKQGQSEVREALCSSVFLTPLIAQFSRLSQKCPFWQGYGIFASLPMTWQAI